MSSRNNGQCECCNEIKTRKSLCQACSLIMPHIAGQHIGIIQRKSTIDSLREELNYPGTNPSQIWRRVRALGLTNNPDSLTPPNGPSKWTFGEPPKWDLSEDDIVAISTRASNPMENSVARRLARGGILPDGTHVCYAAGLFFVDGHLCKFPYRGVSKMLNRHPSISKNINWHQLLFSVDLALNKLIPPPFGSRIGPNTTMYHSASRIVAGNIVDARLMHDILRPWELAGHYSNRGTGGNARDTIPARAFNGSSWLSRWNSKDEQEIRRLGVEYFHVPVNLVQKKGKLFLRVRRNRGWKTIEVESDPRTWQTIVTWALSPPCHDDHIRLRTLQQHIFADSQMELVGKSDINGIRFLREVIENNDRARINKKSIVVEGTSGLSYAIIPGNGGHNTRFEVTPIKRGEDPTAPHRNGWARSRYMARNICIVETPQLRQLVLGDALGSITLTLLDDLKSQRHINTLRTHIRNHQRRQEREREPELEYHHEALQLRRLLAANRVDIARTRATESFPRLFSVLLRLPLGSRVTFTAINRNGPPNLSFDDCQTTFRTRNGIDRNVIYRMLEATGWIRDHEEAILRGETRVYIRTGTGARDLSDPVEEISRILEPTIMVNGRVRIVAEPLWHFFERQNPGTGHLLPGTNAHIS